MTPRQRGGWLMEAVLFVILAIVAGCLDSGVLFTPLLISGGTARARLSFQNRAVKRTREGGQFRLQGCQLGLDRRIRRRHKPARLKSNCGKG